MWDAPDSTPSQPSTLSKKPQDLSLTLSKIGPVRLPPIGHLPHFVHHDLLLMVQKSGIHQLRLVVFAIIHQVFYITGGCLGFLNHQWRISIHCHLYIASLETPNPFHGPNHVFVGNFRVSRHAHLTCAFRQGFLFQWRQSPAGPLHEAAGGRRWGSILRP